MYFVLQNKFLLKSAKDGNIDNVQYALDHGADINCRSSGKVSNTLYIHFYLVCV